MSPPFRATRNHLLSTFFFALGRKANRRLPQAVSSTMGDTKPAVATEGESSQSRAEDVVKAAEQPQEQVENKATTVEMASSGTPAAGTAAPAAANGHKPEPQGDEGEGVAQERAPSSEPPTASTRKRKAGQDAPPAGAAAAATTAAESKPKPMQQIGLAGGVKRENLAAAVRRRMDEVLKEGEDDEMRQDARLINFLGEVEEAQVCSEPLRMYKKWPAYVT